MTLHRPDIRLVSPSLGGGGSERVCLVLANHWASEGRAVELLLIRGDGEFRGRLHRSVVVRTAHRLRVRQAAGWLISKLASHPETPVLAFGSDIGATLGLLKRLRLLSSPIVYREWSLPEVNVARSRRWVYRHAIAHLDGVVAQTDFVATSLKRLLGYSIPITRISNPLFSIGSSCIKDPRSSGIRLLAVGRLSREKRFDRLLSSIANPVCRSQLAELIIAGEGELRAELACHIASLHLDNIVSMPGFVVGVDELYCRSDIFIVSSEYEGMPNALIEAIAKGCRVLASGGGGVQELLSKVGLSDCYMNDGDWDGAFAERIVQVMNIPRERWKSAQQRIAGLTNVDRVGRMYYEFCHEVSRKDGLCL